MKLDREAIAARIPQAGAMCLLDEVLDWDPDHIRALSRSHRRPDNPLLSAGGRLHTIHLIEYAAQAAAVHGALIDDGAGHAAPVPGMLAGFRQLVLNAPEVDPDIRTLEITAIRLLVQDTALIYGGEVRGDGNLLLQGRLTVRLSAL